MVSTSGSQICEACGRIYTSGERFCPMDGARLVDAPPGGPGRQGLPDASQAAAAPREAQGPRPPPPPPAQASARSRTGRERQKGPPARDPLVGRIIGGRYRLLAFLGAGGMASVYVARHEMLGKVLALKLLKPNLPTSTRAVERFRREARTVSRINHENVVLLTDFGETEEGTLYMVMEYLAGRTLAEVLHEEGRLPPNRGIGIALQVARALESAHGVGVIHRDLKPENLMLLDPGTPSEKVKILDFGIAKLLDPEEEKERLTRAGMVFGTPEYMSPEQAMGEELDARTDLYSLGLIAWEMLTGQRCFQGRSAPETLAMQVTSPPLRPSEVVPEAAIPDALEGLVLKLLAKKKEERVSSARALVRELVALRGTWRIAPVATDPLAAEAPAAAGTPAGARQIVALPLLSRRGPQAATPDAATPDAATPDAAAPAQAAPAPAAPAPAAPAQAAPAPAAPAPAAPAQAAPAPLEAAVPPQAAAGEDQDTIPRAGDPVPPVGRDADAARPISQLRTVVLAAAPLPKAPQPAGTPARGPAPAAASGSPASSLPDAPSPPPLPEPPLVPVPTGWHELVQGAPPSPPPPPFPAAAQEPEIAGDPVAAPAEPLGHAGEAVAGEMPGRAAHADDEPKAARVRRRYRDLLMALARRIWPDGAPPEVEQARSEIARLEDALLDLATDLALLDEDLQEQRGRATRIEARAKAQAMESEARIAALLKERSPLAQQQEQIARQLNALDAEERALTARLVALERTLYSPDGATVGAGNPEVGLTCGRLAALGASRDRLRKEQLQLGSAIEGLQRDISRTRSEQAALSTRTEEGRQSIRREIDRLQTALTAGEAEMERLQRALEPKLETLSDRIEALRDSLPTLRGVFAELERLRVAAER